MSEFSELVKRFDKIRSYVRDFYIYGFKTREDYQDKSARTYDNERRRIESWFSDYIRYDYNSGHKKSVSITLDSNRIAVNPLYEAWKSKSFTANDIMLHFFILDIMQEQTYWNVEALTDELQSRYEVLFEPQTVRKKLVEYEKEGLLLLKKEGRQNLYGLAPDIRTECPELFPALSDAICFFQGAAPFGFAGSTIMDSWQTGNNLVRFRHDYLVHTLEDEILLPLLHAVRQQKKVHLTLKSTKSGHLREVICTPLKILVSTQTGRRYCCVRKEASKRLVCYRLDSVRKADLLEPDEAFASHMDAYEKNSPYSWGVSFGSSRKPETVQMQIVLDEETEPHIITRLEREGRNGTVTCIQPGLYEYTVSCWDSGEMLPWVKTFTGRILSFTCSNKAVEQRLWSDMREMKEMYLSETAKRNPDADAGSDSNENADVNPYTDSYTDSYADSYAVSDADLGDKKNDDTDRS